ncbi:hypothetical protein [Actinomadura xylanilytica]|uniref:hypothetical protein n=1 Tax=Actinomadura xylanilytica TaxID=887459 RepID=UPI00255B100D|nr:hypothetical protein [Actinomadura xylanilytica]MDL4770757.1 hypothetical protein [Actinomadura xylanilytica]
MHEYFRSNPCKYLARAYMQIGEGGQNLALAALSWVEMPNVDLASNLNHLVDVDVGNIIELSRETKKFEKIIYDERTYISGIKGTFVWSVEVKPVFQTVSDSLINQIITDTRQS